jgi:hypothetical protein
MCQGRNKMEIRKYFELNDKEIMIYDNLWDMKSQQAFFGG